MELPVVNNAMPQGDQVTKADWLRLTQLLDGDVRTQEHIRMLYATDASPYQVKPLGVVQPKHRRDIVNLVRWCRDNNLSLLPRGAGSSLAGQTVNHAVVVDCSVHMTECTINAQTRTAIVGPGVVLDDLRRAAAKHGLTFGPEVSTSAQATLGGMVANNSAGLHSLWWGTTGDHVLALDVVLGDGAIARFEAGASAFDAEASRLAHALADVVQPNREAIRATFPQLPRNNGGYRLDLLADQFDRSTQDTFDQVDLARLMCGSEGTLACITSIELQLVPIPACTGLIVLGFDSVQSALQAVPSVLATNPSAVELLDADVLLAARSHPAYSELVDQLPGDSGGTSHAVLFVDMFVDGPNELHDQAALVRAAVPESNVLEAFDVSSQDQLWGMRKAGLGLLSYGDTERMPVPGVEDCVVSADRLAAFQQAFDAMLATHGVAATWYAHASVGLLHVRPRLDLRSKEDRALLVSIGEEALGLVQRFGGAISGEHGDGRIRSALMHEFYGPKIIEAFVAVKELFDPHGRFNPGIIVSDPGMLEHLRVDRETDIGEKIHTTGFHWRNEGSFERAAAQCNGQGMCRKSGSGAMCPSYRATRDERHSTRGRGNALRLAMTGQIQPGEVAIDDPQVNETLSLCLGCKACRYECPSQVDVTKLKAEYDAQRWAARGGAPWRVRARAGIRSVNRIGSMFHRIANLMSRLWPIAWAVRGLLGMHQSRALPTFGPALTRWSRKRQRMHDAPVVLLYQDCFTTWSEPQLGKAAIRLLEAFGYRVVIPKSDCCGRTSCSAGMLDRAASQVAGSAAAVRAAMLEHNATVVLAVEPSCATALQQEWTELQLGAAQHMAEQVAEAADTVESFLLRQWGRHPRHPDFAPTSYPVVLHMHCHQKHRSMRTKQFMERCGFSDVKLLDSGCCGMAGSFGYDRETRNLSMRIAEQSLGEAIRSRRGAIVAANGTSCRHQISDAFSVQSHHPLMLAHGALCRARG